LAKGPGEVKQITKIVGKEVSISAVVIAKNEEEMIEECLKSLSWADERLVIDNASSDKTTEIAKKMGASVFKYSKKSFSRLRNIGLKKAKSRWILYIDADERVTSELRQEILATISNPKAPAYAIPRKNIILGREMIHGGWWPDYVKRLFVKSGLLGWEGELHEEPKFEGGLLHLKKPIVHIKHSSLSEMVEKSNEWSLIEAKLLFESNHPPMVWWRFLRIMISELFYRLIILRGFLDGPEGVIYSFYQSWSRFLTYAKLWEMQINH
jgi:glycosyltransferase involved in cell wall biosynthesis